MHKFSFYNMHAFQVFRLISKRKRRKNIQVTVMNCDRAINWKLLL